MRTYNYAAIAAALSLSLTACTDKATDTPVASITAPVAMMEESLSCDRECVLDVGKSYLAALAAKNPSAAPLAEDIRFVENITKMVPGEGLWESIVSGPDKFQIFVPDEVNQTVGYLGMMTYLSTPPAPSGSSPEEREEWAATEEKIEQPVLVALRLQLEDGEVIEAEHLLATIRQDTNDDPNSPFAGRPAPIERLQTPRPGIFTEIPKESRIEHGKLIEIGLSYYDALDDNDGTLMDFADDCQRHENGMVTAGPELGGPNIPGTEAEQSATTARDCSGQLSSKTFTYIDRIENRRVFAADPVTGLVIGLSHFRHPMDNLPYDVIRTDGSTVTYDKERMPFAAFDLPAAHIFKLGADGKVHEIEAMGFTTTYNAPTGWEDDNGG